jgi:8-oxo-dGTP diphosphatase
MLVACSLVVPISAVVGNVEQDFFCNRMHTDSNVKQVVAAILLRDQRVLICQRREDQLFALEWEFPGGKVEPGEEHRAALSRELHEELGISAVIGPKVATVRHQYKKQESDEGLCVELHFFVVREFAGEIENRIFRQLRWEPRDALDPASFLAADRKIVRQIKEGTLDGIG